ncbi:MAG: hypothetical protein ABJF88_00820 [Rhodothermales bacterium]
MLQRLFRSTLAALFLLLAVSLPVRAQSAADARAAVPSPLMLARGDAGVALPDRATALFYNPAHLGQATGAHVTITGLSIGSSSSVLDAIDFYENELANADDLSDSELEEVEDRAYDLLGSPITLRSTVHLPSFSFRAGSVGVGFGAFVQQTARAQAVDTGARYPEAAVFGQVDGIVALAAGAPVVGTPLTLGVSGRYVQRHVSAYREEIDDFDTPPLLRGSTLAFDVGALYQTKVPGLTAGLAVYDLVGGGMSYSRTDFYGLLGDVDADSDVEEQAREALEDRGGPSLRLGAAYQVPAERLGGFGRAAVMADWLSSSTTEDGQGLFRKLRLGAEAGFGPIRLRGGFGQGYPSVGAGLDLLVLRLDYALYAQQEGLASASDGATYAHFLQVRIGR